MREELKGPKVEGVAIAVVQETSDPGNEEYAVYILNFREDILEGVLITSTGYGVNANTGEKIKTSTLRHTMEVLLPNEVAKIEPIMPELFGLSNEYWVSFWINEVMYDRKYTFPAESITLQNLKHLEHFNKKGVIIK